MSFLSGAGEYEKWYQTPFGSYAHGLERELIFSLVGSVKGRRALDVGCGTGIYSVLLAERGANVTGIDPSKEMLSLAGKRSRDIKFVQGTGENMPFHDNSFDIVLSVTALEFMDNRDMAAKEMKRVVKPGGIIVVGTLNKWSLYCIWKKMRSRFKKSFYGRAKFLSILDLKGLFGEIEWHTTLFALPFMPGWMLKLFHPFEKLLSITSKPFGTFIAMRVKNP